MVIREVCGNGMQMRCDAMRCSRTFQMTPSQSKMKTSVLAINFSADDLASSLRTAPFALVAKDLVPARNLLMERPARPAALNACESMTQESSSARKRMFMIRCVVALIPCSLFL